MDSIFNLRRPYDLMAMMRQEEHAVMLNQLKQELLLKKEQIDRNEDRDTGTTIYRKPSLQLMMAFVILSKNLITNFSLSTGLEERFYREDPDCLAAGKPLLEFDLLISTVLPLENKGIRWCKIYPSWIAYAMHQVLPMVVFDTYRPEEHLDFNSPPPEFPHEPECTEMIDLDYSIHAFEHLEVCSSSHLILPSPLLVVQLVCFYYSREWSWGQTCLVALSLVWKMPLHTETMWMSMETLSMRLFWR